MIVSRIDGGLGNQLFQYAYGLYLARRHGTELALDTRAYESGPQHGYLLDRLQIDAPVFANDQLHRLPRKYREGALWSMRSLLPVQGLKRHKESPFGFRKSHLHVANDRYLVGYWQSEQFFPGMRDELLSQFQPRFPLSEQSSTVLKRIQATESAVLHIRRGDYVSNPDAAKIYTQLPLDYYTRSLEDWVTTHRPHEPEVFVFSNDMHWCKQEISLPWKTHWVDHNSHETAHEDMLLMSHAKCNVIANSTFSWWAAWLNSRPGKAVYAPADWFQPNTLDGSNLICESWKMMHSTQTTRLAA